nr:MAG TPA: hypothetical protein [Caudoviricetes sp.]
MALLAGQTVSNTASIAGISRAQSSLPGCSVQPRGLPQFSKKAKGDNQLRREQFTFYRSYYDALKNLPEKERAKVLFAILEYALDEQEQNNLEGVCAACFLLIRPTLDSGRIKAANRKNKAKTSEEQNGNKAETNEEQTKNKTKTKAEQNRKEKEKEREVEVERENDSSPPKAPVAARRFTPPTVEDVAAYCRERGSNVDAQRFVDFYASKGWKVGNVGMKDWHAAVRTWESRDNRIPAAGAGGAHGTTNPFLQLAQELEEREGR